MENFNKYFLRVRRVFLENISYETVKTEKPVPGEKKIACKDTIVAQLLGENGIKIIFNRRLNFEPEFFFTLSVSFGVFLPFNKSIAQDINWKEVNIVKEFTENCPATLSELSARTTALIAQITSASGGIPLITQQPPKKIPDQN